MPSFLIHKFLEYLKKFIHFGNNTNASQYIEIHIIVNPAAGAFRRRKTLESMIEKLFQKIKSIEDKSPPQKNISIQEYFTKGPGHARQLAKQIAKSQSSALYKLIIAGGGDGTNNEICTGLIEEEAQQKSDIRIIQLPLGCGNDSTDVKGIEETYNLILSKHYWKQIDVLQIKTSKADNPLYAFNIASMGLDAYVAAWAGRLKKILGKKSYKFASYLFPVFYKPVFQPYLQSFMKPQMLCLSIVNDQGIETHIEKNIAFLAMGRSGCLTYGGGMRVLPNKHNLCIVEQIGILKLLKYKNLLFTGCHGQLSEVSFYDCSKIIVYGSVQNIPLQFDGESARVDASQFPITLERLKGKIRVVVKENG